MTVIALFFTLAPAAAAEPRRIRFDHGDDMIDAPFVTVQGKVIWVDGMEVELAGVRARLHAVRERYDAVYPGRAPEPVIVYQMAPDTPARVFLEVNEAARAEGFTRPALLR